MLGYFRGGNGEGRGKMCDRSTQSRFLWALGQGAWKARMDKLRGMQTISLAADARKARFVVRCAGSGVDMPLPAAAWTIQTWRAT